MKKVIICGPVLSRSGYGEMARLALRALKDKEQQLDLYIMPYNWGNTGWLFEHNEERRWIDSLIEKTNLYTQSTKGNPEFDVSIQVTIPNEWKKIAKVNIGYTAGIETNFISPAWYEPIQAMDKVIVISNHAKSSMLNTQFGSSNDESKIFSVTKEVDVVHFPVRDYDLKDLNIDLSTDFNFLSVCQWGPRKNLEQTIVNFIEEFKNENVGLVLKINSSNDSIMDKEICQKKLESLLSNFPDKKCKVYLLHGHMSEQEMAALYRHPKIKAIVSTTHGEGYGLPLFEAAYNELPVIATDWSGHLDFLTAVDDDGAEKKLFAKVDFELKPVPEHAVWNGVIEKGTSWAYPIQTSYKTKLREVYKDYPRFKSWAKKLNIWVRQNFTEEKVYGSFVESIFGDELKTVNISEMPKISVVTSVYNGDEYIEEFLKDITRQTVFKNKTELLLVNCNSPGNEEEVIKKYQELYPDNIKYIKLESDPGIYAAWNLAIKQATGEYITNANLDDRKSPKFLEELGKKLMLNAEVDVVYAENLLTKKSNETWENNSATSAYPTENFSIQAMLRGNPPHCMPMWRKSLHDKCGYFEEKYRSASDWEFWLRCAFAGVNMLKLNKKLGLYYFNPKGMSTNPENNGWKREEEREVFKKYNSLYNDKKVA